MEQRTSSRHTFLKNAAVLTVSALILRALSLLLRVWLAQKIGPAGIGQYQLILSIFLPAVSIASGGISLTVTRLTSLALGQKKPRRIRSGVRRCLLFSLCFSALACFLLILSARPLAVTFLGGESYAPCLWVLSLSLPFMSAGACLRGYFLAMRCTIRPALSEGFEQISGILFVWLSFSLLQPTTLGQACFYMMAASVLSEMVSCLFSAVLYLLHVHRFLPGREETYPHVGRSICHITLPGTLSYAARNCLNMAVNLLIPAGLMRYGADSTAAMAQYGMLEGMVMPFVTFPAVFLTAASSLLIPEAAQAMAQNDQKAVSSLAARALKLTFLFSIPVACLFFFFGVPLGEMFYQSTQASQFFRLLAPLTPLWYLDTIVDSLLKGLDQQTPSFLYNTLDAAVRTGLIWLLLPLWGLRGYIVTLFICSIGNAILSLRRLLKVAGVRLYVGRWIVAPGLLCLLLCQPARLLFASRPSPWVLGLCLLLPLAGTLALLRWSSRSLWRHII